MSILDILHDRIDPDESVPERHENGRKENAQRPSDERSASSAARQIYMTQRELRVEEYRAKIESGFYNQKEVLEKVADAIYRTIRK